MKRLLLLISIFLCIPAWSRAQDQMQMNTVYVNFELDRTPLISGGYFLRDELALEVGAGLAFNGEKDSNGLAIQIGMDKYMRGDNLFPFMGGFTRFEINPNALNRASWKGSRFLFGGRFGLAVMTVKNLAVAGAVGGEFQFNSPDQGDSSLNFFSFSSSVQLRLFF